MFSSVTDKLYRWLSHNFEGKLSICIGKGLGYLAGLKSTPCKLANKGNINLINFFKQKKLNPEKGGNLPISWFHFSLEVKPQVQEKVLIFLSILMLLASWYKEEEIHRPKCSLR